MAASRSRASHSITGAPLRRSSATETSWAEWSGRWHSAIDDATLTPGATSETIEVSGVAAVIDTTTAQLQSTYNDRLSQDLGIASAGGLGAGVLNLSLLSPGVSQASSLGTGSGPSVGGQRPYNNNFTVEGVDNNNKTVTGYLIVVPNDAVESFTLLQNQFGSEFGHPPAASSTR